MSTTEKAFGVIKSIILAQERMDGLEASLASLSDRLARLADSHAALRDRVSSIEGYIRGRADQAAVQGSLPGPE